MSGEDTTTGQNPAADLGDSCLAKNSAEAVCDQMVRAERARGQIQKGLLEMSVCSDGVWPLTVNLIKGRLLACPRGGQTAHARSDGPLAPEPT